MATPSTLSKSKKDETILNKIGTITRRKKDAKEVAELQEEGKNAIDSPGSPIRIDVGPEYYQMSENDERSMIEPSSREDPKVQELIKVLLDWVNDELADQRIIVKHIEEDFFDGQVVQKLVEKLSGVKIEVPEVTQTEIGQKQKLHVVINTINSMLELPKWNQHKWSIESVHSKNLIAVLHLLIAIARHFKAPIRLPENVSVSVVVVQKRDGLLHTRRVTEEITGADQIGAKPERDAFDTLFEHAPDKLMAVKQSLIAFVNKHLNRINLEVTDLDSQFHDGVYLVLLMGLLENYFVPLYSFYLTPTNEQQKAHNVSFAYDLMQEAGLAKPKPRAEDVVNLDLKSTLRILYNLFTKYKSV